MLLFNIGERPQGKIIAIFHQLIDKHIQQIRLEFMFSFNIYLTLLIMIISLNNFLNYYDKIKKDLLSFIY